MNLSDSSASHRVSGGFGSWIFVFFVTGFIYTNIELLFRGYTHPSMIVVGGLCGSFVGLINEKNHNMRMWVQCVLATAIILIIEFISGFIINIRLGLGVWDYSSLRFNIMGQVSLLFGILWFMLSVVVIWLDDYLRYKFFGEEYYGTLADYLKRLIELK